MDTINRTTMKDTINGTTMKDTINGTTMKDTINNTTIKTIRHHQPSSASITSSRVSNV